VQQTEVNWTMVLCGALLAHLQDLLFRRTWSSGDEQSRDVPESVVRQHASRLRHCQQHDNVWSLCVPGCCCMVVQRLLKDVSRVKKA
jgi:hypothetical protein